MTILALDPARLTGWAHLYADGTVDSGTKSLGPDDMRIGPLLHNLDAWLTARLVARAVTHLYYEQPWVGTKQAPALVLCALAGQIELAGFRRRIQCHPTLNGVFIKHFTGGAPRERKARKARTIAECESRGYAPSDDNEADAIALLDYAVHELGAAKMVEGPLFAIGGV